MAKQQLKSNPSKTRNPIRSAAAALNSVADLEIPAFLSNIRTQTLLLFGLAVLLYANTLGHGFVQDDAIVINDNMFTKQGFGGINGILTKDTFFGFFKVEGKDMLVSGGRYRPFTLVLFAMIYQFFGDNPFPYHLLTVVLFATTVAVLYRTLLVLFSPKGDSYAALVAWMAALLFAVHPIHTEVVANIKGCDEIVTLLGSLIATWLVFKSLDTGKVGYSIGAAVAFFLACLSKENAATFVVVIPLALYFFRPNIGIGKIIAQTAPVWGAFVLFFILRGSILQWKFGASAPELMNNPYLKFVGNGWTPFSAAERLATIIYTLGKYILLLIVPHPLTHDYYPRHIGIMNFGNLGVMASLAAYIGLIWYALTGWTKRNPIAFGILYFVLTLSIVSNLVFPVGTNMGERFAFMPSVGYCIIASVLLAGLLRSADGWVPSKINIMLVFLGTIGVLYAFKTVTRNPVWESNEKLFMTDVATSGNSAKIRNACGGVLFDKGRVEKDEAKRREYCTQALEHLNKALEIYPNYSDAFVSRGGCNVLLGNYEKGVADYRAAEKLSPNNERISQSLGVALRESGKYYGEKKGDLAKAMQFLNEAWTKNNKDVETARLLGVANGMGKNHAEALKWFQQAVDLEPTNASTVFDLGTAWFMVGDKAKADELHQKAVQLDPQIMDKKSGKIPAGQ